MVEYFVEPHYWHDGDSWGDIHIGVRYGNEFRTICGKRIPITAEMLELLGRLPEHAFLDSGIPRTNDLYFLWCESCRDFADSIMSIIPRWKEELDINKARDSV